jgi:phage-related holin
MHGLVSYIHLLLHGLISSSGWISNAEDLVIVVGIVLSLVLDQVVWNNAVIFDDTVLLERLLIGILNHLFIWVHFFRGHLNGLTSIDFLLI